MVPVRSPLGYLTGILDLSPALMSLRVHTVRRSPRVPSSTHTGASSLGPSSGPSEIYPWSPWHLLAFLLCIQPTSRSGSFSFQNVSPLHLIPPPCWSEPPSFLHWILEQLSWTPPTAPEWPEHKRLCRTLAFLEHRSSMWAGPGSAQQGWVPASAKPTSCGHSLASPRSVNISGCFWTFVTPN